MSDLIPSLENRIHQFLAHDEYRPLKRHELARALRLRGADRTRLRRALLEMESSGKLIRLRKNRWALPDTGKQVLGTLRVHPQGFAFLIPEAPGEEDVFIPEGALGTALHGDRVMASVLSYPVGRRKKSSTPDTGKRREGRILNIIERGSAEIVGHLMRTKYYWYVVPDNRRFVHDIRVRDFAPRFGEPKEHHKVAVELDPWEHVGRPLSGLVTDDLGPADAPGVDILCVMRDHKLSVEFDDVVEEEALRHSPTLPESGFGDRRDLREWITFTIDPADARDFDDAVSLRRTQEDRWELGIHIADVATFVEPSTAIDREARLRGTSVYLVDRVLPMLPAHLTTEVCSLQANEDRLTHSVSVVLSDSGDVISATTYPSVIRSCARLNYEEVQTFFDDGESGSIPPNVAHVLKDMRGVTKMLRALRIRQGSLEFNLAEIRCILGADGKPTQILKRTSNEAYQLIEEFMLLANRTVATFLADKEVPMIYRIHPEPDEEQWLQMSTDLHGLGVDASPSTPGELNAISHRAQGTPMEYPVNLSILRNLKRAHYSTHASGHFGLAFPLYTHFTSPIRRYPDLVVHRILKAAERGERTPHSFDDIADIAVHCSQTEREANDAEQESVDIKRLQYYQALFWKGDTGPFNALVVSIVRRGLLIELTDTLLRGLVPFSSLDHDYYQVNAHRTQAIGRKTKRTWKIGDLLQVELTKIDLARRFADFKPAVEPTKRRKKRKRR